MKLIVDSGSTKTTWRVAIPQAPSFEIHTIGINPVRDDESTIRDVVHGACASIRAELTTGRASSLCADSGFTAVFFYGAGCLPAFTGPLEDVLKACFPTARLSIESDLLGAARALCGHGEGIACILGTGSNSCLFDGEHIVENVSPLGWILGDEGSGAVLGRTLVGDLLKGVLPEELRADFLSRFDLTPADIIERVYRQPQPNRFLASLVPFLAEHRAESPVRAFLIRQFRRFFRRNVSAYRRTDLPVNFVGGIAYQFEDELREAASAENFEVGKILKDPVSSLEEYHQ